jgi:hypothetical protein
MQTLINKSGLAIIIVFVMLFATILCPSCSKKPQPNEQAEVNAPSEKLPTTFSEQVERDKERFLTPPQPVNEPAAAQPAAPAATKSKTIYVKELDEIEDVEAERLLNVAVPGLSIGRLPMSGYSLMVSTCRQITQRWPDSHYAYTAKRMLAQLPEQSKQNYGITSQEVDTSIFEKARTGTQPYTVKE